MNFMRIDPIKKSFFLLPVLLFFIHCRDVSLSPSIEPIDNYGIVFVLYTWAPFQAGVITKTDDPDKFSFGYHHFTDIASVTVNSTLFDSIPTDSLHPEHPETFYFTYNYFTYNLAVLPGKRYDLSIYIPGRDTVRGYTIVPKDIELKGIVERDEYYFINWQGSDSLVYEWLLYGYTTEGDSSFWGEITEGFAAYTQYARIKKEYIRKGEKYKFYIESNDMNRTRYIMEGLDRSGIDKEYGLFGSMHINKFEISF